MIATNLNNDQFYCCIILNSSQSSVKCEEDRLAIANLLFRATKAFEGLNINV
jgi:hypothetical protein